MTRSPNNQPHANGLELLFVSSLIVVVFLIEVLLSKPRVLFNGPFWLDECITDQVVEDPSISHAMQAIRHGVDTNPPVFHLIDQIIWPMERAVGIHSPRVGLRLISMLSVAATLMVLFQLLRRTLAMWPALAGVAAVWAHPDVVEQATDARFYGPLLLAATITASLASDDRRGLGKQALLALAAALLCTLHYFGIISLLCIASGVWVADRQPMRDRVAAMLPMLAGPIALAFFLPWIGDQAAGLSVKTWLDPFSFFTAKIFLAQVLCPLALLVIIGSLVTHFFRKASSSITTPARQVTLPLLSLALVPIIIVLFSATSQSALRSRYAIPAALALAPLAAAGAALLKRSATQVMIATLSLLSIFELHGNANRRAALAAKLADERRLIGDRSEVLFAARSDAVEFQHFAPELADQTAVLEVTEPDVIVRDFRRYENDMLRKTAEWYPTPTILQSSNPSCIPPGSRYLLISPIEDLPAILDHHPLVHIAGDIYHLAEPISVR